MRRCRSKGSLCRGTARHRAPSPLLPAARAPFFRPGSPDSSNCASSPNSGAQAQLGRCERAGAVLPARQPPPGGAAPLAAAAAHLAQATGWVGSRQRRAPGSPKSISEGPQGRRRPSTTPTALARPRRPWSHTLPAHTQGAQEWKLFINKLYRNLDLSTLRKLPYSRAL